MSLWSFCIAPESLNQKGAGAQACPFLIRWLQQIFQQAHRHYGSADNPRAGMHTQYG